MADKGVLFGPPMVQALLAGRKTQTRRLLSPQPDPRTTSCSVSAITRPAQWMGEGPSRAGGTSQWDPWRLLPHSHGDRLWVREAWRAGKVLDSFKPRELPKTTRVWHEVDRDNCDAHGKYRYARFMPRWASRITLTVTDVRVERLQSISEIDAIAEGVIWQEPTEADREWAAAGDQETGVPYDIDGVWTVPGAKGPVKSDVWGCTPQQCYQFLWNSLHDKPGERWEDNPWVVATSFAVAQRNIDAEPQP